MKKAFVLLFALLIVFSTASCNYLAADPPKDGQWYCEELNATFDFDSPFDDVEPNRSSVYCNGKLDGQDVVLYYNLFPRVTVFSSPEDNSRETLTKARKDNMIYEGVMWYRSDVELFFRFEKNGKKVDMLFRKITSSLPHHDE